MLKLKRLIQAILSPAKAKKWWDIYMKYYNQGYADAVLRTWLDFRGGKIEA